MCVTKRHLNHRTRKGSELPKYSIYLERAAGRMAQKLAGHRLLSCAQSHIKKCPKELQEPDWGQQETSTPHGFSGCNRNRPRVGKAEAGPFWAGSPKSGFQMPKEIQPLGNKQPLGSPVTVLICDSSVNAKIVWK